MAFICINKNLIIQELKFCKIAQLLFLSFSRERIFWGNKRKYIKQIFRAPADILGNDIIAQNEFEQGNIGNSNPSGTTAEFGVDSKLEAVSRELKKHQRRRRSLQISGDSFNGSTST